MKSLKYAVIIATYERPEPLRRALQSLVEQTWPVEQVIIVDASARDQTKVVCESFAASLPMVYVKSDCLSSARQRNEGIELCTTPYVLFLDDDAIMRPNTVELLGRVFIDQGAQVGGVGGRMEGQWGESISWPLRFYYRIQAGYAHPNYGGKLFGAAINRVPCIEQTRESELVATDWLPSCAVLYRTELVRREKFPEFEGYSYMEDVHQSARIARTHRLYFHSGAFFVHEDAPSSFKRSRRQMVRGRMRNQRIVAREVMGQSGVILEVKFLLHRLVTSLSLVRRRGQDWIEELIGLWT